MAPEPPPRIPVTDGTKVSQASPLRRLFGYARPYRWRIVGAFVGMLVYATGSAGLAWLVKPIFDNVHCSLDLESLVMKNVRPMVRNMRRQAQLSLNPSMTALLLTRCNRSHDYVFPFLCQCEVWRDAPEEL